MRILNRKHIPWLLLVLLATLFASWVYLGNFAPARLSPNWTLPVALLQRPSEHRSIGGTPVGLIFGTTAFAIFIFGVLLSLRKRIVLWPIGSVQSWMRAHIWLTLLTIPLVLFHSGFRLGGIMTTVLVVLYVIVMVSGVYGLLLQHQLPRKMQDSLPTETIFEQIPYVRSQLFRAAQDMCNSLKSAAAAPALAQASGSAIDPESESALVTFLQDQILPYLNARRGYGYRLADHAYSEDTFRFVKLRVAKPYQERVAQIESWCDQRRMLDLQLRLHHWLHAWLLVHVPFSFLLLLLTAWHAFVTLFYY